MVGEEGLAEQFIVLGIRGMLRKRKPCLMSICGHWDSTDQLRWVGTKTAGWISYGCCQSDQYRIDRLSLCNARTASSKWKSQTRRSAPAVGLFLSTAVYNRVSMFPASYLTIIFAQHGFPPSR